MPKSFRSFLVRCWQLDDGQLRIELEHIQSGETFLAHTATEAVDWVCSRIPALDDPTLPIVVHTTDARKKGE